jgi:hypothetical protein
MKETIRKKIDGRVFKKNDIIKLAELVERNYSNDDVDDISTDHIARQINYRINCTDNTTYESGSIALLKDEDILDIKKTKSIEFSYSNYKLQKSIKLQLSHSGNEYDNCIISGDDRNWVNGTFSEIIEKINSAEPRDNFIIRHPWLFYIIIAISVGFTVVKSILFILGTTYDKAIFGVNFSALWPNLSSSFINYYIHLCITYFIVGTLTFALPISRQILKLWPLIEFDFGPEHSKLEKKRRKKLSFWFLLIIGPLIVSVIYDIIKSLFF